MPLPLPDLDTRKWTDLVEEGRSLIPRYAPDWTDHNVHDPGVTLVELMAWLVEQDMYRLNRIPDAHRRKFLALVHVAPDPPRAARSWLGVAPQTATAVPAGTTFLAQAPNSLLVPLRSTDPTSVVPITLHTAFVQLQPGQPPLDQASALRATSSFAALGLDPSPGAALWLAFDNPLPVGTSVRLALTFDGDRSSADERARIAAEPGLSTEQHHSAAIVWEVSLPGDSWLALEPTNGQVADTTRALTLDGSVLVSVPTAMGPINIGGSQHYALRARLESGAYDAPPMLRSIVFNAVPLEQTVLPVQIFPIRADAQVQGTPPPPGPAERPLRLTLDPQGSITALSFLDAGNLPALPIVAYAAPQGGAIGALVLEAVLMGRGTGLPSQTLPLPIAPIADGVIDLYSLETDGLHTWQSRPDFDASSPADAHFVLDGDTGTVRFGDGNHGHIPLPGTPFLARYAATRGSEGNVPPGTRITLAPSLQNWARLAPTDLQAKLSSAGVAAGLSGDLSQIWSVASPSGFADAVTKLAALNLVVFSGGQNAETLGHTIGRAVSNLQTPTRAITGEDYEALALVTPGTAIARARALPGQYTPYACLSAPGVVSLVIVPAQTSPRPTPSRGLLSSVRRYVGRRRILGTHLEVVAPEYVQVQVTAGVRAKSGADAQAVKSTVISALNAFLDPLRGGPTGTGWPFGRAVYRAEVLQVIDGVLGVDTILTLELSADGQPPQCGNVCVGATHLVISGQHTIEVTSA